jgi:hypothetical protein
MEKTYIAPEMEMTEIKMDSMIAASDPTVHTDPIAPGAAESREIFDDRLFDEE